MIFLLLASLYIYKYIAFGPAAISAARLFSQPVNVVRMPRKNG